MSSTGRTVQCPRSQSREQVLSKLNHLASPQKDLIDMAAFAPSCSYPWHTGRHLRQMTTPAATPRFNAAATHATVLAGLPTQDSPDFHGIPNPKAGSPLMLSDLREKLIRQEETIIFALIERAQFRRNAKIYVPGAFDIPGGSDWTFSQYLLFELEKVYAKVRRYTSPDEYPFSPESSLPQPILSDLDYPETLKKTEINVNDMIRNTYRNSILPGICQNGDDGNYGSSATCDVACLQALSKRIHYGKFIAEAKCQSEESVYKELATQRNRTRIWNELSNRKVEQMLLKRVERKARSYGSDISAEGPRDFFKVDPSKIAEMYQDFIIPLTKEVEVEYIIQRYEGIDYDPDKPREEKSASEVKL